MEFIVYNHIGKFIQSIFFRKRESDAAEESAKRLKKLEDDKKKWEVSTLTSGTICH